MEMRHGAVLISGARRGCGPLADPIFHQVRSRLVVTILCSLIVAACGRDQPTMDPAVLPVPAAPALPAPEAPLAPTWPAEYGILVAVPAPTGEGAALIPPLAPSVGTADAVLGPTEGLDLDLFARAGGAGVGVLSSLRPSTSECPAWPQSPLASDAFWRVALTRGAAMAIPLDSIEGLTPRDSSRLAIDIAALASRIVADTVVDFRGLPFAIRGAWIAPLDSATTIVIALVSRTLAVEDDPRSEQLTLIAERSGATGALSVRFSDRRAASESQVDIDEILALVRFTATGRPGLMIERADARGAMLLLIERDATGWAPRWRGPRTGC
jgi:hypothetical protein